MLFNLLLNIKLNMKNRISNRIKMTYRNEIQGKKHKQTNRNLALLPAGLFPLRSSLDLDAGKDWRKPLLMQECGLKERERRTRIHTQSQQSDREH